MPNYLTRKKTLMGKRYEVEVSLAQYGGDVVRLHAIPDLELARIEDRCGYKLEDALAALSTQGLTEEEIKALKTEGPAELEDVPRGLNQENAPAEKEPKEPSPELILKASQALTPSSPSSWARLARWPWSRIRTVAAGAKVAMSATYSRSSRT